MKSTLVLFAISLALFLGGCADQSLMTDEEYRNSRGPAPHSPDYSAVIPQKPSTYNAGGY
jgi:outer membrane lipoprotein SlyB